MRKTKKGDDHYRILDSQLKEILQGILDEKIRVTTVRMKQAEVDVKLDEPILPTHELQIRFKRKK